MNDKDSRGQYLRIMEKFASVDNRFNQIDVEKTDKIFDIVRKSQQESRGGIKELVQDNETLKLKTAEMQQQNSNDIEELSRFSRTSNERFFNELDNLKEA